MTRLSSERILRLLSVVMVCLVLTPFQDRPRPHLPLAPVLGKSHCRTQCLPRHSFPHWQPQESP